jgi:hypothetical protein
MASTKDNETRLPGGLRNASEPFTISLSGEPYLLTKEQLLEQADSRIPGKRKWDYLTLKFTSFENGVLKFRASRMGLPEFEITVHIEPDKLHVSCSCGQQAEKLCIHALKSLEKIIWYEHNGERYFERYQPGGIVETGLNHPKLFTKDVRGVNCDFTPKKHLGNVYHFCGDIAPAPFANMLNLPGPSDVVLPENNTALTYVLMFPNAYWQKTPSFLLPCLGIKNKAGTDVKAFGKFLSGTEQSYEPYLSEGQQSLNTLCYEMWKQAENTNGRLLENDENDQGKLRTLFSLWKKAIPYLERQEYVYRHPFYRAGYLKGKPTKSYMHRIRIKKGRPKLCFHVADKGDFYWLYLRVDMGGKTISQFNSGFQFFIECKNCYYLVSSLRDVGILEWMRSMDNRITIFKEHFEEFEDVYLNLLMQYYPVKYLNH